MVLLANPCYIQDVNVALHRRNAPKADLEALRDRAVKGDAQALEALFVALMPLVHKHVFFILGGSSFVDDVVQQSMLEIHKSLRKFKGKSKLTTWALAITKRVVWKHIKKEKKHASVDAEPEPIASRSDDLRLSLARGLATLPLKQREAFVLVEVCQFTLAEVAELTNRNANTVASQVRRARIALSETLGQGEERRAG